MKKHLFLLFFISFCSFSLHAQTVGKELKKKHYGTYKGEIPAYSIISDTSTFSVDATPLTVQLTAKEAVFTLGRVERKGNYRVFFKGKDYFAIDLYLDGGHTSERIVLNEKKKTIFREGTYPQPSVTLKKIAK